VWRDPADVRSDPKYQDLLAEYRRLLQTGVTVPYPRAWLEEFHRNRIDLQSIEQQISTQRDQALRELRDYSTSRGADDVLKEDLRFESAKLAYAQSLAALIISGRSDRIEQTSAELVPELESMCIAVGCQLRELDTYLAQVDLYVADLFPK
jgi:hypothetical protein